MNKVRKDYRMDQFCVSHLYLLLNKASISFTYLIDKTRSKHAG